MNQQPQMERLNSFKYYLNNLIKALEDIAPNSEEERNKEIQIYNEHSYECFFCFRNCFGNFGLF